MRRTLSAAALLLTLCASSTRAQERVVSARAGLVTRAEGEVLYHCHEKGEGVGQLVAGARLHDGDLVYTGKGGHATWSLNPDSFMTVSEDSAVRVFDGSLDRMHFDVERGEVTVVSRSLKGVASLVVHAPPGQITVRKPGLYLFRVAADGETEASVGKGKLTYVEGGKTLSVKRGRKVNFRRVEKKIEHGP